MSWEPWGEEPLFAAVSDEIRPQHGITFHSYWFLPLQAVTFQRVVARNLQCIQFASFSIFCIRFIPRFQIQCPDRHQAQHPYGTLQGMFL